MELDELYTDIILEYSKDQTHRKPLLNPHVSSRGVNPSCGDQLQLELSLENGMIQGIGLTGSGCAISEASAAMMADLIEGKTLEEALALSELFIGMIKKTKTEEEELEALFDAIALRNISNMPARVKCAVLGWHTLQDAIHKYKGYEEGDA